MNWDFFVEFFPELQRRVVVVETSPRAVLPTSLHIRDRMRFPQTEWREGFWPPSEWPLKLN
jgi:hypothetical protein